MDSKESRSFLHTKLPYQQLLVIWRKAKGKERNALLWGDEVSQDPASLLSLFRPNPETDISPLSALVQIEYLVVAIDQEQKKVRLSLCQADVLKALAKDEELSKTDITVPDLQNGAG